MKILTGGKYRKLSGEFTYPIKTVCDILREEYKDLDVVIFIAEKEYFNVPHAFRMTGQNIIMIDPEANLNSEFTQPEVVTKSRLRNKKIKEQDFPDQYKMFLDLLLTITHEIGHYKMRETHDLIDFKRYREDMKYRRKIENEAEQETDKILKKYLIKL